jgi:hypothetical protein
MIAITPTTIHTLYIIPANITIILSSINEQGPLEAFFTLLEAFFIPLTILPTSALKGQAEMAQMNSDSCSHRRGVDDVDRGDLDNDRIFYYSFRHFKVFKYVNKSKI